MKNKIIENLIIILFCLLGASYILLYFNKAVIDVPVSDYLRIINYYYENVYDLHYLLSIEGISRVPFTFLTRMINASIFNFSTNFDRCISIVGLSIFNFVILQYVFKMINNNILKIMSAIMVSFTSFSLISWEMLLNGTAHPHYIALGLFAIVYYLFDKYYKDWYCDLYEKDIIKSIVPYLVFVVFSALCFGGSYMVAFLFTLSCFCFSFLIINFVTYNNNKKLDNRLFNEKQVNNIVTIIISLICVLLFQISNNSGEPFVHIGMKEISLGELLKSDFTFPIRFLSKALVSSIIGVDNITFAMQINSINDLVIYGIAILIVIMLIYITVIVIIRKYYQKYLFIMLFAFNGIANYFFIFFARYKFVDDTYGMTSRYGIQYMFLTIAVIMLLFKIVDDNMNESKNINSTNCKTNSFISFVSIMMILCLLSTNHTTNYHEQLIAPYRKEAYEKAKEVALDIDSYNEEELPNIFEYHRGVDQIKKAFAIIKKNRYNVFR